MLAANPGEALSSLADPAVYADHLAKHLGQQVEGKGVGSIAQCAVGIFMHLEEEGVGSDGCGSTCEYGYELAAAAGGMTQAARLLHGVCGIETNGKATNLTHGR